MLVELSDLPPHTQSSIRMNGPLVQVGAVVLYARRQTARRAIADAKRIRAKSDKRMSSVSWKSRK